MAKAGLSWTGNVASQRGAGSRVQRLGKIVNKLFHCAEALALAVTDLRQSEAGKGERVVLQPHGFVLPNSERVGAGHLGAVCCAGAGWRERLAGCWAA